MEQPQVIYIKIRPRTIIKATVIASLTYSGMRAVVHLLLPPVTALNDRVQEANEKLKQQAQVLWASET